MHAFTICLLAAGAVLFAVTAADAKRRPSGTWQPAPAVKDCTRLNGRFGYYGNPWCTKAEQDAFDRATSRRLR